jgi:hypothetical protein
MLWMLLRPRGEPVTRAAVAFGVWGNVGIAAGRAWRKGRADSSPASETAGTWSREDGTLHLCKHPDA